MDIPPSMVISCKMLHPPRKISITMEKQAMNESIYLLSIMVRFHHVSFRGCTVYGRNRGVAS